MRIGALRVFALVLVLGCGIGSAAAKSRVAMAAKEHSWRFATAHGIVRVWWPANYNWRTAGMVVYVHGFRTDVDSSWKEHNLVKKFRDSKRNALFIVAEAPAELGKPVVWTSLSQLIGTSLRLTRQRRPKGKLIVVGHSGAYLTIVPWLKDAAVTYVILIDGLYGCEDSFTQWLYKDKNARKHRMVVVSYDSVKWADPWVKGIVGAVTLSKIPAKADDVPKRMRRAKVLYMRSQYDHMALIERDDVFPMLLQLAPR